MYRLLIFSMLFLFWVVLSGFFDGFHHLTPMHVFMGVFSAGFVTWISSDCLFENRDKTLAQRARELIHGSTYLCWLLWQIVLANLYILKLTLSRHGLDEVEPRVIRFRTKLKSNYAKYCLAQSITLTPGTVTVKVEGDEFIVHAISKAAADGLDGRMEGWLAYIYEPGAERPTS